MRCLITGVSGFVGSSICDALLGQGARVTGIDCFVDYYPRKIKENNLILALRNPNFSFIESDLLQVDLKGILADVDVVFHQSAQAGVRASWGQYFDSYVRNNILATQALLEAARDMKRSPRFVFASSSSVYGLAESLPTSENHVPAPISPYGVTKLASENLMTLYAAEYNVRSVSLRYFTVFGPRQRPDMAFNKFIRAGLRKEKLHIYGDGFQSRDFTYIDDIVRANLLAAEKGEPGDIFNIGGGTQATVNEVLEIIGSNLGDLNVEYQERQRGDARHTSADTSRAREKLGFKPLVSLSEGLGREIEWLKENIELY